MKRHEALTPLSHHHHHALVVALDLKRAGTENSSKSYKTLIEEMNEFWKEDGEPHFQDEEMILFPIYLIYAEEPDEALVKKALYQHTKIRGLVKELRSLPIKNYDKLNELGHLLDEHIRLEERELFPLIEKAVPDESLYEAKGGYHKDSVSGR